MLLRHLRQAQTGESVPDNRRTVNVERRTPYPPSLQLRSTHSRFDPFDDEAALQLRNGSDDYDHRTTQWPSCVDVFAEADELDAEVIQFVQ